MDVYKKALENYNSGIFLQLEGSIGRYFVSTFLDSGILKIIDEPGNKVIDGYGREIQLKKAEIDYDRIDELWDTDFEFMEQIEEVA
tara:strand:- start:760 stop:1017 length:258 start_codon:yes stop_codon:yes gene_type:complete